MFRVAYVFPLRRQADDAVPVVSREERIAKAQAMSQSRIFSQDDFAAMRRSQLAREIGVKTAGQKRKTTAAEDEEQPERWESPLRPAAGAEGWTGPLAASLGL